jgi:hypothetical protein
LRAAVTGLSSPLSMLNCGTCSKILRPSCRLRLFRLRLLANRLTSSLDQTDVMSVTKAVAILSASFQKLNPHLNTLLIGSNPVI